MNKITEIINRKEVSYDVEILKNKIKTNEEKREKYIILKNSIKDDLKEKFITEEEYWEYNSEYSKKINELKKEYQLLENKLDKLNIETTENKNWINQFKKIDKVENLDKLLIEEFIEDIVIDKNKNLKVIFKCEDKYFEAVDFINKHKCDIIP